MKVLSSITVGLLFVLFIASCGDDDPPVVTNASLDGTWLMTSFDYDLVSDSVVALETLDTVNGFPYDSTISTLTTIYDGTGSNMTSTLIFTTNPNNASSSGSFDINATATVDGQTTTLVIPNQSIEANGTWLRSLNLLSIRDGASFVNGFEIVDLTMTTLEIKLESIFSSGEYITDDKKYTITNTANHTAIFTRQ